MPGYIKKALQRLNHKPSPGAQFSPHQHTPFTFLKKGEKQHAKEITETPTLDKETSRWIQPGIGSLLYYARALESTLLPTLNQLGTQQALPTTNPKKALERALDYAHTYKNAYLQFNASDMILHVHSDAAYLVLPQARSCIAGYFRLLSKNPTTPHNGAMLIECKRLKNICSSAAEAETNRVIHHGIAGVQ